MESVSEALEKLQGVRYAELNIQRLIKVVSNLCETVKELQDRIRDLEISKDSSKVLNVKVKYGVNKLKNDTHSIDQEG